MRSLTKTFAPIMGAAVNRREAALTPRFGPFQYLFFKSVHEKFNKNKLNTQTFFLVFQ